MNLIADLVKLVHLLLVISVIISVFVPNCCFKEYALILLVLLLVKYILGYNKCGLTQLEYWILGQENHQQGFIYRIVNPIIKVPENYFNNGLLYLHILWIIILAYQLHSNGCNLLRLS